MGEFLKNVPYVEEILKKIAEIGEFLESIACTDSRCLFWILIVLDIFAVVYLIFCAVGQVGRIRKIIGWVVAAVLLCSAAAIVVIHTCTYTILTAVFTVLVLLAFFAIVLP